VIYKQYLEDHQELLSEIKTALGRISFASDVWSDPNLTSFIAMMCHFCKRNRIGSLEVANRLLAFRLLEGRHDGDNTGNMMYDIVKDVNAHAKVRLFFFHGPTPINPLPQMAQWTLDNASNNGTAMETIQRCCAADGIAFDADGNYIWYVFEIILLNLRSNLTFRCYPHVINVSAQTVTKE